MMIDAEVLHSTGVVIDRKECLFLAYSSASRSL
jgi:hypothetical protein